MSLLAGRRVVVVDVETTGISPAYGHRIVEIAAVTLESGEVRERWSTLVRPNRTIPPDARAVHGITEDMVAGAPAPEAAAAELGARVGGDAIAFHHAAFDLPFVVALLREAGLPRILAPVIDTLGLARGIIDRGSHSLPALAERFQFTAEPQHRALGDALTAARLLQALAPRWERERSVRTLEQLAAASQDALRPPSAGWPYEAGGTGKTDFDSRRARPIMEDLFRSANPPEGAQGEA